MNKSKQPCVFVVDSHATKPPLPPRMGRRKQHMGPVQMLLIVLIAQTSCLKHSAGEEDASPTMWPGHDIAPSKPVAHLTDGHDVVHKQEVMAWSMIAEPLLYEMEYKDGSLIIQRQGYYYFYSKVFFTDSGTFHHSIKRNTDRYFGKNITLLQSRKYSLSQKDSTIQQLSGWCVFPRQNDGIHVTVSNTTKINQHGPYENIFGAFMI